MPKQLKIDSRELGLIILQHLLDLDHLHYGLWDKSTEICLANLKLAQQKYNEMLITSLPLNGLKGKNAKILEVGSGTGFLLNQLRQDGYFVDAINPSRIFNQIIKQRFDSGSIKLAGNGQLFECMFEEFDAEIHASQYDLVLFSESFQYIPMDFSFNSLQKLVKPGGFVIICDFFRTSAQGDGAKGDASFGGGWRIEELYAYINQSLFEIIDDIDITPKVSPTIEVVNQILMWKIKPLSRLCAGYLQSNYPFYTWIISNLFKKKLKQLNYKYLSGNRNKNVFEKYKTYRFIKLLRSPQIKAQKLYPLKRVRHKKKLKL